MRKESKWAHAKVRALIAAIVKQLDQDAVEASNQAVICWRAATALKKWR
jgi:hypothetical protein